MGFFDRISDVVRGKASNAVGDIERSNPEAVYAAAIEERKEQLVANKKLTAGLIDRRNKVTASLEKMERELTRTMTTLTAAIEEGDDDTALVLVQHKQELTDKIEARTSELVQISDQVEQAKQLLGQLQQQLAELKREKGTALASMAAAQARIDVADAASGLGDDDASRSLASVRESIGVLNARAHEGYLDEDGNSVRGRAEALGKKARESSARAQLAALKRQMGRTDDADDEAPGSDEPEAPGQGKPKRSL